MSHGPKKVVGGRMRSNLYRIAAITIGLVMLFGSAQASALALAPLAFGSSTVNSSSTPSNEQLETEIADSIIAQHINSHGGWAFESAVQSPNYQTDRDVGAASVGMGLLDMHTQYPSNPLWLHAAEEVATWLMNTSVVTSSGGRYWHDYNDPHATSSDVYTSFDDGSLGIGDYFWRLYEATSNPEYKTMAYQTLEWTFAEAQNVGKNGSAEYRWQWDVTDTGSIYYMGMGEGVVGIIETLATYYQQFTSHNPKLADPAMAALCKQYIDGALAYFENSQTQLGNSLGNATYARAFSESDPSMNQDGNTAIDSGYLSGAAGGAYMFLKLYQVFGDPTYLAKAEQLFSWLEDTTYGPMVTYPDGSVAFKLSVDPDDQNAADLRANDSLATGFEEGNAGIGWVYLQAYELTGNKHYLEMAERAAQWLSDVAVKGKNGSVSWHEDMSPTNPLIHVNLDNGAAGISIFFEELYSVTKSPVYKTVVNGAQTWVKSQAKYDSKGNIYWVDNSGYINGNSGPTSPYQNDTSWHWGSSGILAALLYNNGGRWDIPGEQSALMAPN